MYLLGVKIVMILHILVCIYFGDILNASIIMLKDTFFKKHPENH